MRLFKIWGGLIFVLIMGACTPYRSWTKVPSVYTVMDSVKINYKTSGSDQQPLVFVHGFGCDMNSWRAQFKFFSKQHKLIFIDLPGYGQSAKPHTAYTLDFYANAVKTVLLQEKVQQAVLIGHSLGTPVCRQLIYNAPELVSKLVDVDGVYCFYPADSSTLQAYSAFAESFNTDSLKSVIQGFVMSLCGVQTPLSVQHYAMSLMPETPKYVAYSMMKNLIAQPYWLKGQISIPTLVMASVNSQIPPNYRQIMSNLYSEMVYKEFEGVGHFIMMEQPKMFNKILKSFIEK